MPMITVIFAWIRGVMIDQSHRAH